MSASVANRTGPEAVLEAIFTQAFSGGALKLPAGVTRADLRAALALKPSIQTGIYEQIRLRFRRQAPTDIRWLAKISRKRAWLAAAGAIAAIFVAGMFLLHAPSMFGKSTVNGPITLTRPTIPHQTVQRSSAISPPAPVGLLLPKAMRDPAALAALQSRAATGDADAAYALASLLDSQRTQNEVTVPKDDKAAFALYKQAAQAGNTEAEFATGQAYQTGRGVKADATLATAWYRAAALNGLATAQTSLGFAYQIGMGIPQDYAAASLWFSRAAAQADSGGETALGYLYLLGQGVAQDQHRGFAMFSKASAQNFGPAFLALGYCYAQGLGTAQNIALAAQYFLKANQSGVPQADAALATFVPVPVQEQSAASLAAQAGTLLHPST